MNISNLRVTKSLTPLPRPSIYWTFADALVLAKRHLIQIPRIPEELIFATIQPIMFVLLFAFWFLLMRRVRSGQVQSPAQQATLDKLDEIKEELVRIRRSLESQ